MEIFSNPVTVNLDVGYGEIAGQPLGSGAPGESEAFIDSSDYAATVAVLTANETTNSQIAACSTLPATTPLDGGTLWLTTAQEKALGLLPADDPDIDGYVGFSSTLLFYYSTAGQPARGQYYFIGDVVHEMTEVMGRASYLGDAIDGTTSYAVMDLFRYSAPGACQLGTGGPAYFSIDNGTTDLDNWNTNSRGDLGDWNFTAGDDAFLAFSRPGQVNWITPVDLGSGATCPVSPSAAASASSPTAPP